MELLLKGPAHDLPGGGGEKNVSTATGIATEEEGKKRKERRKRGEVNSSLLE